MKKKRRITKRERVESVLITYKLVFNILGLEKYLSFPKGTIHKFLKYNRRLSSERINQIDKFIQEFIDHYEKEYKDD
ncbi:hypothetical protein [Aquimarina algicola]|uniref:Uncharacterized protein n=1 Tax=Aquimarina algicola TaxID=2589995 RepID=A0A504IWD6_9FLAO|nr:hypothetical protein [Aquimarina algicola]TPN82807.1 hypothetical protein FHK87_20485 [Aquimarina algicola]